MIKFYLSYILISISLIFADHHVYELSIDKSLWNKPKDITFILDYLEAENVVIWYNLPDYKFIISKPHDKVIGGKKSRHLLSEDSHVKPHVNKFKFTKFSTKLLILSTDAKNLNSNFITHKKIKKHHFKHKSKSNNHHLSLFHFDDIKLVNETIKKIQQDPTVIWIQFYEPPSLLNKHALKLLTLNKYEETMTKEEIDYFSSLEMGTLITMGDSGADFSHCTLSSSNPIKMTFSGDNAEEIIQGIKNKENVSSSIKNKIKAYINMEFQIANDVFVTDFVDLGMHGSHVAGSLVGNYKTCSNLTSKEKFISSNSQLLVFDFQNGKEESLLIPPSIYQLMEISYALGSRIFSNSWGANVNEYTSYAAEMDEFMYFHDDYLIFVANGNEGPNPFTVGAPATLKNGISVGATQNTFSSFKESNSSLWETHIDPLSHTNILSHNEYYNENNIASFSSRGPTRDGRMKPTLVAPGMLILSTRSQTSQDLMYMQGTSMATPILAHTASLLLNLLKKKYNQPNPSSYLLKNLLISSSIPLRGGSIQYFHDPLTHKILPILSKSHHLTTIETGYGRGSLQAVMGGELSWMDRQVINSYDEPIKFCFKKKNEGKMQSVFSIVWNDVPAFFISDKDLVNDLNLRVILYRNDKVQHVELGNHLPIPDNLNNAEKVVIDTVAGDVLRIVINAKNPIITLRETSKTKFTSGPGSQTFSFVYSSNLEEIPCDFQCTNYDSEYTCMTDDNTEGMYFCDTNNMYDRVCHNLCDNPVYAKDNNQNCICNLHVPCLNSNNSHELHFSLCNGTDLTPCEHFGSIFNKYYYDEAELNYITRSLQQYSYIAPSKISIQLWLICYISTIILSIFIYMLTRYF